jgi:hypothetical protein
VAKVLLPYLAKLFIFPKLLTNICMKGEGFRLLGWQWGAGRVKENTFGIQSMFKQTQKFGPQL